MKQLSYYFTKEQIVNNDTRFIRNNPDLLSNLKNVVPWCESNDISELLFVYRSEYSTYPKCNVCNNSIKRFINGVKGYHKWCSKSCYKLSPEWQNIIKVTSQQKYGTDHPLMSSIIQNKRKATNLSKYGDSNPMRWGGDLFAETMIKTYGAASTRHVSDINEKILKSINDRNLSIYQNKLVQHLQDLEITPINQIDAGDRFSLYKFKHSCGEIIESSIDKIYKIRCFTCHRPKNLSNFQFEVETFIKDLGLKNIIRNDRKQIAPLELDIFLPDLSFAIETHGDYWHSDLYVENDAHFKKYELTSSKNIKLLQIFESEWTINQKLIKSIIKSKLGFNEKLFARKMNIVTVDKEKEFFSNNHLQGFAKSSVCYGLELNGELICAMSFDKPRFNKKYDWELIRYASKVDINVIGGASRLLTHFIRNHNGTLMTYADKRFSTGDLYRTLGFTEIGTTKPNYWYVNFKLWKKISRYQAQKRKLKQFLGEENFIESLSEVENMNLNGWRRIYDAGNLIFELIR